MEDQSVWDYLHEQLRILNGQDEATADRYNLVKRSRENTLDSGLNAPRTSHAEN